MPSIQTFDNKLVNSAVAIKLSLDRRPHGNKHLSADLARLTGRMNQEEYRHYKRRVEH